MLPVVGDCSYMGLYERMGVFAGIILLEKNRLNIMNFPSKMRLSSISVIFEMGIHSDPPQMCYKYDSF